MHEALLVMKKDLRLEWRSKVGIGQVLPFSLLVVLLFAFALDPERGVLERVTSGLFWVVVLFSSVLTIERAFSVEANDGIFDALRLSGMAPAAIYAGKVAALTVQLLAIEAVLAVAVAVFYDTTFRGPVLTIGVAVIATLGIAGA
ncbi:MAG TPA: heme exporter protein CcmB, partial [Microthrixaceae bacterium]|nr:heme exporter protein CcmB [Microthrixaceae bacterium]